MGLFKLPHCIWADSKIVKNYPTFLMNFAPLAESAKHEDCYDTHAERGKRRSKEQTDSVGNRTVSRTLNIDERVTNQTPGDTGHEDGHKGDSTGEW